MSNQLQKTATGIALVLVLTSSCRNPYADRPMPRDPTIATEEGNPGQSPGFSLEKHYGGSWIDQYNNPDFKDADLAGAVSKFWSETFGGDDSDEMVSGPDRRQVVVPPPEAYSTGDDSKWKPTGELVLGDDGKLQPIKEEIKKDQKEFEAKKDQIEQQRALAKKRADEITNELKNKEIPSIASDLDKKVNDLSKDIDKAISDHNASVGGIVSELPENVALPTIDGYEYRSDPKSPGGRRAREAADYVKTAKAAAAAQQGLKGEHAREVAAFAEGAVKAADGFYASGNPAQADFALDVATSLADVALGLTPGVGFAKDCYEVSTGKNLLTGKKLTKFERTMAAVGVLTAGYGSKLALLGKAGAMIDVFRAGTKDAALVADATRAVESATEIAEAAVKAGIKDKKVLDDIAETVKDGFPCKVALHSPLNKIFSLFIATAYAAGCEFLGGEEALKEVLDSSGKMFKDVEGGVDTFGSTLSGAKAIEKETSTGLKQFSKPGGFDTTVSDFNKFQFDSVKNSDGVLVGTMSNGNKVIARSKSSGPNSPPTLEFQRVTSSSTRSEFKIRYGME